MKGQFVSMLITGLALALGLLLAVEISQNMRAADEGAEAVSELPDRADRMPDSVEPVIFTSISESGGEIFLEGSSPADATILLDNVGTIIREVIADDNGRWRTEFPAPASQAMVLEAIMVLDDGTIIRSDETVFRIPAPVIAGSSTGPALIMITAPGGPSRIIQSPFDTMPADGPLSMGPLDYDESGGVIFSGLSTEPGRVRIFADNVAVGETNVSPSGRWYFIAAGTLPPGSYNISAELLTGAGSAARVSVPFNRMSAPEQEARPVQVSYTPVRWQIRRRLDGGGHQYTAVFAPAETLEDGAEDAVGETETAE